MSEALSMKRVACVDVLALSLQLVLRAHPEWGEEVVACVVPRVAIGDDDARRRFESALDVHCRGEIARFKRPRHYVFVDALPKNHAGKVLKTALRERFGSDCAS